MRRLTVARDRELRHVAGQHVAWRWSWPRDCWYPWCRVCGRDARQQIDWLINAGYVRFGGTTHVSTVNVQPTELVGPYLERYPR